MRCVIAVLLFATIAAPAVAAPPRTGHSDPAKLAQALGDPLVQGGAAAALAQLAGIVLDTRVGPLAALTDPRDDVRPSDTLGDLERRRDPAFDRHLRDGTRRAVGTAGAVAGGVVAEKAELDRTVARLRAALAPLAAALAPQGGADDR